MKMTLMPGLMLLLLLAPLPVAAAEEEPGKKQAFMTKGRHPYSDLEPSDRCLSCHRKIYRQYQTSAMARAQILPWDQAEYFQILLPHVRGNPELKGLEDACIRCHAPAAYLAGDVPPPPKGKANPKADGVTCDVCHTMTGVMGDRPYNGNYRVEPGTVKYGPRREVQSYHHESEYRPIQTSAEMCGTCHDETSFYGAWVKETYREWKESPYAEAGIQCMDCHEPAAAGKASPMGPERPDVTQHLFMGGNAPEWMNGAAVVSVYPQSDEVSPGRTLAFQVVVVNQRAGHPIPTGSTEERQVWLHVEIEDPDGKRHHVKAALAPGDNAKNSYSVAHNRPAYKDLGEMMGIDGFDGIPRDALPEGDRLYRKVFLNPDGEETIAQWFAKRTDVFDNRLEPLKARTEGYEWSVPEKTAEGVLNVEATLSYRRLPQSVADLVEIGTVPVIEIGKARAAVRVSP
jgi:hypothetical protein